MASLSYHNDKVMSQEHNRRNPKVVDKEPHIKKGGDFEIWKDIPVRQAYDEIFGKSLERYNNKQKRKDRKKTSYFDDVKKNKKLNVAYEIAVGIYPEKGMHDIDIKTAHDILKEYVDKWQERNPNLELIGAYYHADERGEMPHVHIDYVPVGYNYKKGLDTQNSLEKAFKEMGIEPQRVTKEQIEEAKKEGIYLKNAFTRQIVWQDRERHYIADMCAQRGIEVHFNVEERRGHMAKEEYILYEELKDLKEEYTKVLSQLKDVSIKYLSQQDVEVVMDKVKKAPLKKDKYLMDKAFIDMLPNLLNTVVGIGELKAQIALNDKKTMELDKKIAEVDKTQEKANKRSERLSEAKEHLETEKALVDEMKRNISKYINTKAKELMSEDIDANLFNSDLAERLKRICEEHGIDWKKELEKDKLNDYISATKMIDKATNRIDKELQTDEWEEER